MLTYSVTYLSAVAASDPAFYGYLLSYLIDLLIYLLTCRHRGGRCPPRLLNYLLTHLITYLHISLLTCLHTVPRADAVRSPTLDAYLLTYYLLTYLLNYSLTCGRQERPAPNTYLLTYSLTCIPTYLLMTYTLTCLLAEAARAPVHHVHVLIYLFTYLLTYYFAHTP